MASSLCVCRERILKDLMENTGLGNVDDLMHIERVMREINEKLEQGKAEGRKPQVPPVSVGECRQSFDFRERKINVYIKYIFRLALSGILICS